METNIIDTIALEALYAGIGTGARPKRKRSSAIPARSINNKEAAAWAASFSLAASSIIRGAIIRGGPARDGAGGAAP
jgi:hypothetical protein